MAIYKNKGWVNWGAFFQTWVVAPGFRNYKSFNDARTFARDLKLPGKKGWEEFSKSGLLPIDIPVAVSNVYKNKGWTDWGDFLGTGRPKNGDQKFVPFEEARRHARVSGITSGDKWREAKKQASYQMMFPVGPKLFIKTWVGLDGMIG